MPIHYSTRDAAEFFGVDIWRIQRLFEDGTLNEPRRFAGRRVITPDMMPRIVDALRDRGWLPQSEEVATS